jgi:hypothetical protein
MCAHGERAIATHDGKEEWPNCRQLRPRSLITLWTESGGKKPTGLDIGTTAAYSTVNDNSRRLYKGE